MGRGTDLGKKESNLGDGKIESIIKDARKEYIESLKA
jgi:hypothetical protein